MAAGCGYLVGMTDPQDSADKASTTDDLILPGAVVAALTMVELAEGLADGRSEDEVNQDIAVLRGSWDSADLASAFALLISAGTKVVVPESGEPGRMELVVPRVLGRLRALRLRTVSDAQLPLVAGVLTAAALGQDPFGWSAGTGGRALPDQGPLVPLWCYVTWVLSDLVDAIQLNRAGGFTHLVTAQLLSAESDPQQRVR